MAARKGYFKISFFSLATVLSCLSVAACAGIPGSPKSTESLPFSLTSTFGDRAIINFEVRSSGDIRVVATWSGTTGQLALILNGPGQVGAYKRIDGGSSLVIVQPVTPELLSRGASWSASIVNFDTKGSASGTMRVTYPAAAAAAASAASTEPAGPTTLGNELIVNGDFADGLTNWSHFLQNGASATYAVRDGAAVITIATAGKSSGDIQLSQGAPGFEVQDGSTYRLQFDAKGTVPTKLSVTIFENGHDVNKDGFAWSAHAAGTFQATTDVQTFSMDMHVKGDNPDAGILFLLGASKGEISLSRVTLRKIQ